MTALGIEAIVTNDYDDEDDSVRRTTVRIILGGAILYTYVTYDYFYSNEESIHDAVASMAKRLQ